MGPINLYVRGILRYKDTFSSGINHWTTFCIFHIHGRPVDEYNFCEHGNDIDHNKKEGDPSSPPN
jgi:hypothetical protein